MERIFIGMIGCTVLGISVRWDWAARRLAAVRNAVLPRGTLRLVRSASPSNAPLTTGGISLCTVPDLDEALTLDVPPGLYRVRVNVTGRWEAAKPRDQKPIEQHLIELWPAEQPSPPTSVTAPDEFARNYMNQAQ